MSEQSVPRPMSGLGIALYLSQAAPFSYRTFGPGTRTAGVVAHIRKEIAEIEEEPTDLSEWADLIILAFDGHWRATLDGHGQDDDEMLASPGFWADTEDDILDLLVCDAAEGRCDESGNWPDFEQINELLAEIEGPAEWKDAAGFKRQRRPIDFLFCLIALEGLKQARGTGAQYAELRDAIFTKLERNMGRKWPDWRTASPDQPIEHIRDETEVAS